MYLSQVILKTRDTYKQHQAIWSLFSHVPERKRDHLFRVESIKGTTCNVLLQSTTEPKSSQQARVLATKSFIAEINQGVFYKFKLVAYPSKCLNQNKKVVEIKDSNEKVQWVQRKLSGANVTVTSMDDYLVRSKKLYMSRFVCFEGILQVMDKDQIQRALVMGVGRKKHAGAGLLSLARIK